MEEKLDANGLRPSLSSFPLEGGLFVSYLLLSLGEALDIGGDEYTSELCAILARH
jgi:hypothetical protein